MTRRIVTLQGPSDVARAQDYLERAAAAGGYEVEFRKQRRTSEQNAKMWAMLSDVAAAMPERNGIAMTPEDYKTLFLYALNAEMRMVPGIDGQGFVPLGSRSSKLTKQQFSDLFEVIQAFCAREGIKLSDPNQEAA